MKPWLINVDQLRFLSLQRMSNGKRKSQGRCTWWFSLDWLLGRPVPKNKNKNNDNDNNNKDKSRVCHLIVSPFIRGAYSIFESHWASRNTIISRITESCIWHNSIIYAYLNVQSFRVLKFINTNTTGTKLIGTSTSNKMKTRNRNRQQWQSNRCVERKSEVVTLRTALRTAILYCGKAKGKGGNITREDGKFMTSNKKKKRKENGKNRLSFTFNYQEK